MCATHSLKKSHQTMINANIMVTADKRKKINNLLSAVEECNLISMAVKNEKKKKKMQTCAKSEWKWIKTQNLNAILLIIFTYDYFLLPLSPRIPLQFVFVCAVFGWFVQFLSKNGTKCVFILIYAITSAQPNRFFFSFLKYIDFTDKRHDFRLVDEETFVVCSIDVYIIIYTFNKIRNNNKSTNLIVRRPKI